MYRWLKKQKRSSSRLKIPFPLHKIVQIHSVNNIENELRYVFKTKINIYQCNLSIATLPCIWKTEVKSSKFAKITYQTDFSECPWPCGLCELRRRLGHYWFTVFSDSKEARWNFLYFQFLSFWHWSSTFRPIAVKKTRTSKIFGVFF